MHWFPWSPHIEKLVYSTLIGCLTLILQAVGRRIMHSSLFLTSKHERSYQAMPIQKEKHKTDLEKSIHDKFRSYTTKTDRKCSKVFCWNNIKYSQWPTCDHAFSIWPHLQVRFYQKAIFSSDTLRSDVEERMAEERLAWNDKNIPAWPKNISVSRMLCSLKSAVHEIRTR